jgi:ATP-binding cassette subfamily B protein
MIGDLIQRIADNARIESFLTSSTLNTVFSMINLLIFGIVLIVFNTTIFMIFATGSALYLCWVYVFLKKRRELDYKRFTQLSSNQSNLFQIITGIQEIKLNNIERQQRWEWERIQAKLFKLKIEGLKISQYQESGSAFINQAKNVMISFFSAKAVIDGDISLGTMMAIQYIIGMLNGPIEQLISLLNTIQDAKISLERLNEIHKREDEEKPEDNKIITLPKCKSIQISHLCFQYEGPNSEMILNDLA